MQRQKKWDRRSQRSRRLIVDALLALMLEKRFERITVQEIIDRADVGRTTFYAQFSNKEDVLLGEFERVFAQLREQQSVSAEAANHLLPSLQLFRHVAEQLPLHQALVRSQSTDLHYQGVRRHLRSRAAQQLALITGSRPLAVPPEIVADYLAGALLTLVHWWLDHGMPYTPEQMEAIFQQLTMPCVRAILEQETWGTDRRISRLQEQ